MTGPIDFEELARGGRFLRAKQAHGEQNAVTIRLLDRGAKQRNTFGSDEYLFTVEVIAPDELRGERILSLPTGGARAVARCVQSHGWEVVAAATLRYYRTGSGYETRHHLEIVPDLPEAPF